MERVGKAAVSPPLTPPGGGGRPRAMQRGKAELRFGSQPHSSDLLSPHCGASCGTPNLPQEEGAKPPPPQPIQRRVPGSPGGCWVQGEGNGLRAALQGTAPGSSPRDPSSIREEEKGTNAFTSLLCSQPPEQTGAEGKSKERQNPQLECQPKAGGGMGGQSESGALQALGSQHRDWGGGGGQRQLLGSSCWLCIPPPHSPLTKGSQALPNLQQRKNNKQKGHQGRK